MNHGLHQQLAEKRRHLEIERTTAASIHADPRDAHEAGERAARDLQEIGKLSQAVHVGEAAAQKMAEALTRLDELPVKGRELALAATYLETAAWRLRKHLGNAEN